jgi:hypothetical protein
VDVERPCPSTAYFEKIGLTKSTEALLCLSCESRAQLDELARKAVAAGGTTYSPPQDYGFMYQHGYQDPDGHIWELIYMEPDAVNQTGQ